MWIPLYFLVWWMEFSTENLSSGFHISQIWFLQQGPTGPHLQFQVGVKGLKASRVRSNKKHRGKANGSEQPLREIGRAKLEKWLRVGFRWQIYNHIYIGQYREKWLKARIILIFKNEKNRMYTKKESGGEGKEECISQDTNKHKRIISST